MKNTTSNPVSGPNPLCPERMSADARVAELGRILAVGVIRLNATKSSSLPADNGDLFVDLPVQKSAGRRRKSIRIGGIYEASQ